MPRCYWNSRVRVPCIVSLISSPSYLPGCIQKGNLLIFPRVIYYLSLWYTRPELGSRIGIFYASLVASSAFGGVLAYGVFRIEGTSYFRWSYLFFLEGSLTVAWGIILFFTLPGGTQTAWFLTTNEKEATRRRLQQDSPSTLDTGFRWSDAFLEYRTPHGWIRFIFSFVGGTLLTSNANFLAMVVARLGYDTLKTNLVGNTPGSN